MPFALATIDSLSPPENRSPAGKAVALNELAPKGAAVAGDWIRQLTPQSHPLAVPLRRHWLRTRRTWTCPVDAAPSTAGSLAIGPAWQEWAWYANVIWLSDDGQRLFDPAGRLLLDRARLDDPNHSDPEAVIPSPKDARQRQAEIAVELRNRMIDPIDGLIPVPGIGEVTPRSSQQVAERALALFLVATRAESILGGHPLDTERMRSRCPIGFAAISPAERAFFDDERLPADGFVWRYESLLTLQWALDMQFELPWPDEHADLTAVTRLMVDLPDQSIVDESRLRSLESILAAAERHQQLYYVIAMGQNQGTDAPAGIDPGVICERMIALAWILNLPPQTGVSTKTDPANDPANDWDTAIAWVDNGMI